jgi:hypothetical protein
MLGRPRRRLEDNIKIDHEGISGRVQTGFVLLRIPTSNGFSSLLPKGGVFLRNKTLQ